MMRKWEGEGSAPIAPASSSRDEGSGRNYEVFLNFRGSDTRSTIVDCLYKDMICAGIRAFKDSEELQFGEKIEGGLLQAINDSRIYIPIFSKDYASSKWCLYELARIVELSRDNDEKVILPIFYDVDVDDVKLKTDLYKDAFQKHKNDSGEDLAKQWEEALREVTKISGRKLKDHGLYELMNLIVKEVSSLLWTRRTNVPTHLVGIKDRTDEIMKQLDLEAFDVRFIVIYGMGGIGKTTLAEAVFKQISPQFQRYCCFLKDVRTHDIINLQKKLLSDIFHLSCRNLYFIDEGADMIKMRFHDKKVLIVLDDIDNRDQIMRLAGEPNWFGGGSRIIITTRNIEFLVKEGEDANVLASISGQFSFYNMPEMNSHDAFQLFCERALGCAEPPTDYMDIANKLINTLGGLPLALDVVGSTLRGKCRRTWEDALCKLKKVMNEDVKKKLMISYEALELNQQQIYLDIACFCFNKEKTVVVRYWDAIFGYPTEIEVNILKHMSLIKISSDGKLWMHDQLKDLGRNIVHPKSGEIHLRGSRLWSPKDAFCVVQTETGTKDIVALNLGTPDPNKMYRFKHKQFEGLVNLRFLQLDHGNFEGDFKNVFFELRWLSWSNCPSKFRATNFGLKNLTILMLSGNNVTENWGGWCQIMVAKQLKILQLEDCPFLRKTPKFSILSQLEKLILRCLRLRKIDKSIGNLQHLDYLEIKSKAIESPPESIGGLKSLTVLRIEQTPSMKPHSIGNLAKVKPLILPRKELQKLPDSIGQLDSLLELDVRYLKISELPHSIGNLERLKVLRIRNSYLEKLPDSIGRLQSLVKLDLSDSRIRSLPDCIGNLKKLKVLNLNDNCISEFPKTIGMLENLEELDACSEHLVGQIPSEIGALSSLKYLYLCKGRFSGLPTTINQLKNLQMLSLLFCDSIQQLPELPKSLNFLSLISDSLTTIPDCSNLTNLVDLMIIGYSIEEPNTQGIVRLPTPKRMALRVGKMTLPPTNFNSLSQLQSLSINYAEPQSPIGLPSSLQDLWLCDVQSPIDWSVFSNLGNLSKLSINGYSPGEIRFKVLGELQKFNELRMFDCPLLKTLPVLPCLKEIQCLSLIQLPQLIEIQGLGELKLLQNLSIWYCNSIKRLNKSDLSNLQNLKRLRFWGCKSLERVLGVPKSCRLTVDDCPRFNRDG
ncbi:disease resistance protein RUN1-like [Eucalyptus grandis]|uniref:disease resistance protein RUN1-like n=1 Tax=Eucalyptus grandis TaxID=71139 RepID=UPI00192F0FA6|nr:disease resistance protein RUN1-like [Eucalyptus grandis]